MIRRLYHWTMGLAGHRHARVALGTVSFTESSFFPIPADVLFVPMCLSRPEAAMRYALIATVTSVLGGIFGWMIGYYAYTQIAEPMLAATGKLATFEALKASGGTEAILVMLLTSGLSHIPPMKVVTILSGAVQFDLKWFILSAIIARGGRFYGFAWLLSRYGAPITAFIERRLVLVGAVLCVLAILAILILRSH